MTFPHLYGSLLPLDAVISVFPLHRDEQGDWRLPIALQRPKPAIFTEIPYGKPGRVYRSVMPGSRMFDPQDKVLSLYQQAGIQIAVVLVTDEDIATFTGQDLFARYSQAGIKTLHAPVQDFSAPSRGSWDTALRQTEQFFKAGQILAIQCHAGIGRTGMFCACMAQDLLGSPPRLNQLDSSIYLRSCRKRISNPICGRIPLR